MYKPYTTTCISIDSGWFLMVCPTPLLSWRVLHGGFNARVCGCVGACGCGCRCRWVGGGGGGGEMPG